MHWLRRLRLVLIFCITLQLHKLIVSAWTTTHRPSLLLSRHNNGIVLRASPSARVPLADIRTLEEKDFVVVEGFLPESLQEELRHDVQSLRTKSKFNVAKIGQDATNELNTNIRVAETCFLGPSKLSDVPSTSRTRLYEIMDDVRNDLANHFGRPLDSTLTELLYAYYPRGGFYRRHRDAIPGSASTLREYSLLLYLNENWNEAKGGALRMHMDSGGDCLPEGEAPEYQDVVPNGGTLVLFKSDAIPHEVLDTKAERVAIVGWYNRPVSVGDIVELSGGMEPGRVVLLVVAAALVTVGVSMLGSLP